MADLAKDASRSPFAPFRHAAFALLWTATLLSNIGTWMHDVAAGWLMTSLSPSPMAVALVQAATTLAMAAFALPAGAMADLFDRRKLLIVLNLTRFALAMLLAALTLMGLISAWSLLLITFLLGVCAALTAPVWQSIVPSLVSRDVLPQAVAMNSMGINVARAIGPAIGGALILAYGVGWVFAINSLTELVIVAALLVWKSPPATRTSTPERFVPAMIAGLRFAGASPGLRVVLLRAVAFFLFASAYWALLPVVVRSVLGGGPDLYGLMVSAVGAGAVAGALTLPRLSDRLGGPNGMVWAGSAGTAVVLLLFALVPWPPLAIAASVVAGVSWIMVLSTFNVAAQSVLPDWVRGRGLSIYGLVFYAAMTVGSLTWGALASVAGIVPALLLAAAGMAAGVLLTRHVTLTSDRPDQSPASLWPEPPVAVPVPGERGPVRVTVEYIVDAADKAAFLEALRPVEAERRRNGAYAWAVYEDAARPSVLLETFEEASWSEHLRHHTRLTKADASLHEAVRRFHRGTEPPVVTHWLSGEA